MFHKNMSLHDFYTMTLPVTCNTITKYNSNSYARQTIRFHLYLQQKYVLIRFDTCNSITEYYVLIPVVQVQDKTIGLVHFISIYATACFVKTGLKAKVTTNMAFFLVFLAAFGMAVLIFVFDNRFGR